MPSMISTGEFLSRWDPSRCERNYGIHLGESSLADYVEWAAICCCAVPLQTLFEQMVSSGVPEEICSGWIEPNEEKPDSYPTYEALRKLLETRAKYLGELYPFEIDKFDRMVLKKDTNLRTSSYIRLLGISLLQGWLVRGDGEKSLQGMLTKHFEAFVYVACKQLGLRCALMGTSSGGSFNERLAEASRKIGLAADALRMGRSFRVQDDGVDVIAGRLWLDGRKGEVLLLIQATCAYEDAWRDKLSRVSLSKWRGYFAELARPYAALAVPYQATRISLESVLDEADSRTLFDRLRLVRSMGATCGEDEILKQTEDSFLDAMAGRLFC